MAQVPPGYPGAGPAGPGAYNPYGYPPTAAYGYGRGPEAYGPGAYPGAVPGGPPGKPGVAAPGMPPMAPPGGFGGPGAGNFDVEAQQAANFAAGFAEQQVRSRFVGKVLSIVFLQLLCTVGMSVLFYYVQPLKLYVRQNAWPFYLSWALSFGMLIAMSCSETLRRKYPTNVLFLGAFTAVFSFQIAAVTSYFNTQAVMIAFIATTAVVLGCAFIAFFTKLDMTKYGGWLAIAGLSFMVVAMIAAFWPWGGARNWTIIGISFAGCFLFALYLIYDLQLIMGGKTVALGPDEYVFASLSIYLDVINIFLMILQLVAAFQRE